MRIAFWSVVLAVVAGFLAFTSCFTVDRSEFVYLTQFGRPVAVFDGETDAGLHTKWPWPVQSVLRFDHRLQFFDLREVELLTHDAQSKTIDKNLLVSAYVTWRIAGKEGVEQFVRAVGTLDGAQKTLEQRINSRLGAEIGKMNIEELIGVAAEPQVDERVGRLRQRLLGSDSGHESLRKLAHDEYGIELVDVRLRRFNHPPSVRNAIFDRIKSERKKKVIDYTSEGNKLAADITSAAERENRDILTEANSEKKRLEEEAAARADAIRNQAHSRDREFYTFLQKLDAYQRMLADGKDMLLLSSRNELFDLLLKPPRLTPVPEAPVVKDKDKEMKKPVEKEPVGPKEGGQ
jgi:membrane protease subunit HflC